jgi:hypothetical protein
MITIVAIRHQRVKIVRWLCSWKTGGGKLLIVVPTEQLFINIFISVTVLTPFYYVLSVRLNSHRQEMSK